MKQRKAEWLVLLLLTVVVKAVGLCVCRSTAGMRDGVHSLGQDFCKNQRLYFSHYSVINCAMLKKCKYTVFL